MVMMILLKLNNYIESREYLEGLIKDYKADFGRFINDDIEEDVDYHLQLQLNKIFDSIPSQHARETDTDYSRFFEPVFCLKLAINISYLSH